MTVALESTMIAPVAGVVLLYEARVSRSTNRGLAKAVLKRTVRIKRDFMIKTGMINQVKQARKRNEREKLQPFILKSIL